MNDRDGVQLAVYFAVLIALAPVLGRYLAAVFTGTSPQWPWPIMMVEGWVYRLAGCTPEIEMRWTQYAAALLWFNFFGVAGLLGLQLTQQALPLNPANVPGVSWPLALNTAVSFVTNTNWQAYSGEVTMSHLTQMLGVTVQNFVSAATGMAVLLALARGVARKSVATVGNFWTDLVRCILYVLFANFAEALAEGRGKAQAESLKKARTATVARRLRNGSEERVAGTSLREHDVVLCEAGDVIPADGEVIEGIASVDESAITGESAPVIRESGGDRSAVTGGTRVISDRIVIRITSEPEMEVVDLPPEELLKRLDEGKVYLPDRAEAAVMNFFRLGNLTSLREMALRLAAEHVGQDVRDYMQAMQIAGPWKSGHRLLVAVSPSPYSANMVRWTRRLADSLDCPWLAVYIERPEPLAEAVQARLTQNLALARQLGAEVITTADTDLVQALLRVARQHNVTQIIVGKPGGLRLLDRLLGARLLQRLVAASGDIDINVVRADKADKRPDQERMAPALEPQARQYGVAVTLVAVVTALNAVFDTFVGSYALALIYLLAVVLLALFVGRGPVILAATLSALLWNFFFLSPRHTFRINSVQDALMFGMYFVVALELGQLTARIRAQERAERRREKRSTALYLLTRDLADATTVDDMAQRLVAQVSRVFECSVALLLREATGNLARRPHPASTLALTDKEHGVAAWVFRFAKPAGRFTDNLPLSEALHLPLVTKQETIGVLSVRLDTLQPPTLEQRDLLDAFARPATLVLDRLRLGADAEQARVVAESERLGKSLLNSVSHELRTPLAAITTAVSALDGIAPGDQPELTRTLTGEIQSSTARLNRLVANLLDMTRLESGHVKPRLEWCDVRDLVNVAMRKVEKELAQHKVTVSLAPILPLVKLDAALMEQVFVNLLVNAVCYTAPATLIEVMATASAQELTLVVADRGPGLPPESVSHVFEKFYRVPGAPSGGTGLGLSIVKGFAEAQGGRVEAANREGGGAAFTLRFPVAESPKADESSQA